MADLEQQLLTNLKTYEQDVLQGVAALQNSSTVNSVAEAAVAGVENVLLPGISAVDVVFKAMGYGVGAIAGAGSWEDRLVSGLSVNPLVDVETAISLWKGRTFETDNYNGAAMYQYFVKGKSLYKSTSFVTDAEVPDDLAAWIWLTGVFVSGSEHLIALTKSAQAYMAYYAVNSYTTQDLVRVEMAVAFMQKYCPNLNFNEVSPGAYSGVVGVYENQVTAAIAAARVDNTSAEMDTTGVVTVGLNPTVTVVQTAQAVVSSFWTSLSEAARVLFLGLLAVFIFIVLSLFSGKSKN